MINKKQRERNFLTRFLQTQPDLSLSAIKDSERPDFLVVLDNKVIGIEVVEYVRGQINGDSVYRRNETLWDRIASKAQHEYSTHHTEPVMVHFQWYGHRNPRKSEVAKLAQEALRIVEQHIPASLFGQINVSLLEREELALSKYAHSISITRTRNQSQVLWSSITAGFISVEPEELQDLIGTKNVKVGDYLTQCNEVWLVVVAEGIRISSSTAVKEEVIEHKFKTDFSKIFFYDHLHNMTHQLNTG